MSPRFWASILTVLVVVMPLGHVDAAERSDDDAQRGASAFGVCLACHSIEPRRHMTGPTLFGVLGRTAGTAPDFMRYSDALTKSGVVWNEQTLDRWLQNPDRLVPGNTMAFPGIADAQTRRDLIAYLKAASEGKAPPATGRQGGMMGMMGTPSMPELKKADRDSQIKSLRHCRDTYFVTTADGKTHKLWEFNVRLKTDSSPSGPNRGQPVLVGVGMRGDRAAIVFAAPDEISAFVKQSCD